MTKTSSPKIEHRDGLTIIHLGEEYENLDETALEMLREVLLKAVDEAQPPKVILDLSHTTFFGSSFIELIFRAWNRVQNQPGGEFVISGLTEYCREVLKVTHLDQLWKLYDDVDTAVAALKSAE
jgi:anti-sigma B factor antagonist